MTDLNRPNNAKDSCREQPFVPTIAPLPAKRRYRKVAMRVSKPRFNGEGFAYRVAPSTPLSLRSDIYYRKKFPRGRLPQARTGKRWATMPDLMLPEVAREAQVSFR
jgi:hypothetical protein